MKALFQWIVMAALTLAAYGQDPLRVLPKNYQLAFENDVVRVLREHYGAREKLPLHDHSKTPTIYVYLSDSGPVRFNHTGSESFELERCAVQTGGFRLSPGRVETHEVENTGDTPSDFLRVELKAVPLGTTSLGGRFAPPANLDQSGTKIEFEDANLRILRTICGARDKLDPATSPKSRTANCFLNRSGALDSRRIGKRT
ncbi:MAG: cupin domain-containing protein [Bryobacteraceae bacterium]